jgi:putative addiction module CopG family antidote
MIQVVAKLDDEMAAAIDALVDQGRFDSRSAVVRSGVSALIERERRARVGAQIVAGYEAIPETSDELSQAAAASRAMINEEPW